MAIQVINVGNAAQDGTGDPLRDAMIKINANFAELYAGIVVQTIVGENGTTLVDISANSVNANALTGTVPTGVATWDNLGGKPTSVATSGILDLYNIAQTDAQIASEIDDLKTELGSGGAGAIDASVLTGSLPAIDGSALTGISAGVATSLDGDMTGSVYADDSTLLVDGVNGTIPAANLTGALPAIDGSALTGVLTAGGDFEGNLSGSVFADDSTILVDGVNGTLNSSALTKPIALADNEKITFGDGNDLEIYHNGTANYIAGAGGTILTGNWLYLRKSGSAENYLICKADGAVEVYYDNVKKLETTTDGVAVTGKITGLTDPTDAQDAATKAYVDTNAQAALVSGTNIKTVNGESLLGSGNITISGGGGGGSAFTNIGVGADDSTIRSIGEGESFLILGGTGLTTTSDAEGNITIDFSGGAITGSSLEAVAVGAGVADGNDLSISGGDATELNSIGGDANITGGSGALQPGNVNIGTTQTTLVTIGSGSNNVDFPNGTAVDFTGTTVTGLDFYTDGDVDTHLNQSTAGTNEVLSWDGADYAWVAQSGGGSGLQSRGAVTGTTSSLADAAEADLDITGFKSYALLSITTDRAARVRLYVSDATRTADASRAEGVDPTSDAGLIAEVITTGADTVIISPGAFGFNLESSPTTTIPCRVTNKSGSTSTVQVDLNILQLEA